MRRALAGDRVVPLADGRRLRRGRRQTDDQGIRCGLAQDAFEAVREELRRGRRQLQLRRLGRARRADQGRASGRTCTRPPTRSCPTSSTRTAWWTKPVRSPPTTLVIAVPGRLRRDEVARRSWPSRASRSPPARATVPIGSYTREVLRACRRSRRQAIERNIRSNEPDVAGIVGKVSQGAVDAGFVYVTDVRGAGRQADRHPIAGPAPAERHLRGGGGDGAPSTRPRPVSSWTGFVRRRTARRCRMPASALPGRLEPRPLPVALFVTLAVTLLFLTLPVAAIFVDVGLGELMARARRPGRGRRASAEPADHADGPGGDPGRRHAGGLSAGDPRVPRARSGADADRAAADPAAGRGRGGPARRARAPGIIGPALERSRDRLPLTTAGVVVALVFVASPFYIRQATAAFGSLDPSAAGGVAHAGRSEAPDLRTRRDSPLPAVARDRRGARMGPGARRVRRHADVRGQFPRRDADRAACDLRAVLVRTSGRAGAGGGARGRERGAAAGLKLRGPRGGAYSCFR